MLITDKGQVTIPKAIRDQFGLLPGTDVEFVDVGGRVEVRKRDSNSGRGAAIVTKMRGALGPGMSTDEIMALTRSDD